MISFATVDKLAIQMISTLYTSSLMYGTVILYVIHHSDVVCAVYQYSYSYILFEIEPLNVTAE